MSSSNAQAPATKLVEVRLSALTRVEYMEVVEVPVNITQEELDDLVNTRYRQVDGGEFTSVPEYWERGTCEAVETDMPNAVPSMMAFRTAHGLHIERADADAEAQTANQENPQVRYVIRSQSEGDEELDGSNGAFWSNEDGWGHLQTATHFSTSEKMTVHLPTSAKMDAEWMLLEVANDLVTGAAKPAH